MKKIGLVVAMLDEQKELYNKFGEVVNVYNYGRIKVTEFSYNDKAIYMADSGIGELSASLATQLLIIKFGCEVILNFGVVGSLDKRYRCGDVVVVQEIVHYDFSLQYSDKDSFGKYPFQRDSFVFKNDISFVEKLNKVIGSFPLVRIASGDKFIDDSKLKEWLVNHFSCNICDMESMGIFLACSNFNVPCFMIKAVSDNADEDANISFMDTLKNGITFYVDAVLTLLNIL